MNSIDTVEGVVKSILSALFDLIAVNRMDDTEYILTLKTVIQATESYLQQDSELKPHCQLVKTVFYNYSKELWLKHVLQIRKDDPELNDKSTDDPDGYFEYFFDYIYEHGTYPP